MNYFRVQKMYSDTIILWGWLQSSLLLWYWGSMLSRHFRTLGNSCLHQQATVKLVPQNIQKYVYPLVGEEKFHTVTDLIGPFRHYRNIHVPVTRAEKHSRGQERNKLGDLVLRGYWRPLLSHASGMWSEQGGLFRGSPLWYVQTFLLILA